MSTKDYSAKLLEMEGVRIENLEETEREIVLQISLERCAQVCKRCGAETERVHDYRVRQVRDLELRGKPMRLMYRRRRYVCPYKDVAKDTGVSISGVQRLLKMAPGSKPFPSTNSRATRAASASSASSPTRWFAAFSIFCRREPWRRFRITCARFPIATR